ncbi:MAG TPA: glycolate oxidase subunit GlcE [Xanthobacteraceae bacterium]
MSDRLQPRDDKDVEEVVRWALAEGKRLEVRGQGSKRALGRPSQTDLTLDLSGLVGVTLYEPEELVLSVKAGTPLSEIEELAARNGQQLAFEPMDYGPIFGRPRGEGTIGGVLAANLSGPRRLKAGAARDHFLGVSAVSGRGEIFKSGGRVVKNVTGYDLCKLLAGSFGTLAAMTEVTIKTLPRPETEDTLLMHGLDDAGAIRAMSAAMNSSAEPSGAAHLPQRIAHRVLGAASSVTALRLEGVRPSVVHRRGLLEALFGAHALSTLAEQQSRDLWRDIRDVTALTGAQENVLWRISTAPAKGAALAEGIAATTNAEVFYDWSGGLIWADLPPAKDAGAEAVRAAVASFGGHATLVRAPLALRASVDVFQPQEPALAALSRRVKESFDPHGVLNPGRMWAGV